MTAGPDPAGSRRPVGVGVVGCGNISQAYLRLAERFPDFQVVSCADLDPERAKAAAALVGSRAAASVEALLADDEVEVVLDLTVPAAHGPVSQAAIAAGKAVYGEKPLALSRAEGAGILAAAGDAGVRVGSAPDTFLGAGLQTCRKLLDEGAIGRPVGATAVMAGHGHEHWHPDPAFYYQQGGGPLLDMGPYYLTALVSLLGPVARVTGASRISFPTRTVTSEPRAGTVIPVEVPTHVAGILEFAGGSVGTLLMSFDVWASHLPKLEIYGTEGSLSLPDPNTFGGPVHLWRPERPEWAEVALTHAHPDNSRGLGLADMARAMRTGRAHRASGALAYHVLDVMDSVVEAGEQGRNLDLASTVERPAPLPPGLGQGQLDD